MKTKLIFFLIIFSNFFYCQQLDPEFGTNGTLRIQSPTNEDRITLYYTYLTDDGSIFNIGHYDAKNGSDSDYDFIRKYSSQGIIDTSFGENGEFIIKSPQNLGTTYLLASTMMNDESIVVSLNGDIGKMFFLKVTKNGKLDISFGNDGYILNPATNFNRTEMATLNENFLSITDHNNNATKIYSINKNGIVNTSFGTNGQVIPNFGNDYTTIRPVNIKIKNSKIYILGSLKKQGVSYSYFARYNENGKLDNTFGNNGFFVLDKFYDHTGSEVDFDVQDDGKVLFLGGASFSTPSERYPLIKRYHENGALDESFGNMGSTSFSVVGSGTYISSNKILQLPNKKILIGCAFTHYSSNEGAALLCLNENGTKDLTFGGNVTSTYNGDILYGLYLLPGFLSNVSTLLTNRDHTDLIVSANPRPLYTWAYTYKLKYSSQYLQVDQQHYQNQLDLYPNPVLQNAVFVNPSKLKIDYNIIDMSGKVLRKGNTKNENINFNNFKTGNYIIKFNDNKIKSLRIIKK